MSTCQWGQHFTSLQNKLYLVWWLTVPIHVYFQTEWYGVNYIKILQLPVHWHVNAINWIATKCIILHIALILTLFLYFQSFLLLWTNLSELWCNVYQNIHSISFIYCDVMVKQSVYHANTCKIFHTVVQYFTSHMLMSLTVFHVFKGCRSIR